MASSSGQMV
uniref:Uncharacterized protein n=1 Tax=Anguilla anguilla TaxID=7936 RepID=A0A0E9SV25_ANGAN